MPDPSFAPPTEIPSGMQDPTGMPPAGPSPMPPSGMGAPAGMGAPTGDAMATPEQKQQLLDLIQKIRTQLGQFHAEKFAGSNSSQQQRNDLLKEVFAALQAAGVDLQDPKSVADFMAKLKQQSPDIAAFFEQAMNQLLGGDPVVGADQNPNPEPPTGPMPMDMNNGSGLITDPQAPQG